MQGYDERLVEAYIDATYRMVDPHHPLLRDGSLYFVTGGSALDLPRLVAHAKGAEAVDADLIHLVFEPGSEAGGPVNVMVGCTR